MGACSIGLKKPIKCKQIAVSLISTSIKLNSNSYSDIHNQFDFIKILGHGQFGIVREATRRFHTTGQRFAIKSIMKQNLLEHRLLLKRELEIITMLDHPNIVRLYETYEDQLYVHFVMELCEGGDVCDRIITQGCLTEREARVMMKQLFSAVNYLHSNQITHRDLKPENFLYVDHRTNDVKICDFGMSIKNTRNKMHSIAGTPYYLAPEIIKGSYTKACDVWSLGVFMYLILTGRHPFRGEGANSIYEKAVKGVESLHLEQINQISNDAKDLISKMLSLKVASRITIAEALQHKWVASVQMIERNVPQFVLSSIIKHKAKSKLWQEATKIIVKNLSNSQIASLRQAFIAMDTSNSGVITAHDLQLSMKMNGYNLALDEIDKIIENCAYIGKGKINYTEFLVATLNKKALLNDELMWEAFNVFDGKSDGKGEGKLNVKQLRDALKRSGCEFEEKEFQEIIAEAELDENSNLDFANFRVIMSCFEDDAPETTRRMSIRTKSAKDYKEQLIKSSTLTNSKMIKS